MAATVEAAFAVTRKPFVRVGDAERDFSHSRVASGTTLAESIRSRTFDLAHFLNGGALPPKSFLRALLQDMRAWAAEAQAYDCARDAREDDRTMSEALRVLNKILADDARSAVRAAA